MEGCENLAMPGLAVGLLVRHLEHAGTSLDPYLADPLAWELEFARRTSEAGIHISAPDDVTQAERRSWTFLDVALWLVVHADSERAAQLKAIGTKLIAAAREYDTDADGPAGGEGEPGNGRASRATVARRWAGTLDGDRYQVSPADGGVSFQYVPPEEVEAELRPGNEELERGREAMRLVLRYVLECRDKRTTAAPVTREELISDLGTARELARNPSPRSPVGHWDAPAAVAAAALEASIQQGMDIPSDLAQFAARHGADGRRAGVPG